MSKMAFEVCFFIVWMIPILSANFISEVDAERQNCIYGTLLYTVWCPLDETFCLDGRLRNNQTLCGWDDHSGNSELGECCFVQPLDDGRPTVNVTMRCDYYWHLNTSDLFLNTSLFIDQQFLNLFNCSWTVPSSFNYANISSSCSNLTSSQGLKCSLQGYNFSDTTFDNQPEDSITRRRGHPLFVFLMVLNLTVSLAGIAIHFAVFILVPSMRNLPGKMLTSLCFALNGAYISFIVMRLGNGNCNITSGVMHYCFLASFFWMNSMAFDICWTFWKATSTMRVAKGSQWRKFAIYSAYSWLMPIPFVVAPDLALDPPGELHSLERSGVTLREGVLICSIGTSKALLLCLVIPVTVIMVVNVALSILSASIIIRNAHHNGLGFHGSSFRYNMKLCCRLSLFVGITWILGIFAHFYNIKTLQYIFSLLNSLQGFLLFVAFTCTKKVYRYICDKVFHIKKFKHEVPLNSSLATE